MTKLTRQQWQIIIGIILVTLSGSLGIDIHLASLPHIMTFLHTDKQHMQQSISIYLLGNGVSLLFYGPLSDQFGRKPVIIVGLIIASITSFIAASSTSIFFFLTMRFMQGLGSGVCWGLTRIVAADILNMEQLSIVGSYITLFFSLSPLAAPVIGAYVQTYFGWQANFILLGCLLLIALSVFIVLVPETNHHKNPKAFSVAGLWHSYSSLLSHRLFIGCTLITGLITGATMSYTTTSSFILQKQFLLSAVAFGWFTACVEIGSITGKLLNTPCVKRFGPLHSILVGLLFILAGGIGLIALIVFHDMNPILFIGMVIVVSFGIVFVQINIMGFALIPFKKKRGAAGALYGSFQMLVSFVASALLGGMAGEGVSLLGGAYIILAIFALLSYFLLVKPQVFKLKSSETKSISL